MTSIGTVESLWRYPIKSMGGEAMREVFFRHLGSTLNLDNVGTLSVAPGLEIDIPINTRWSLKPVAYAGWGTVQQ